MKVKRRFLFMVAWGLALCLTGAPAWGGDDFYVIGGRGASGAGVGASGKVLKTQVFTSNTTNNYLGAWSWDKLSSPQWTYTKLSATSYLVITYEDSLSLQCTSVGLSVYQLRVNDQPNVAATSILFLRGTNFNSNPWNILGATGVWFGLPKGDVNLSIWHMQSGCTACAQGADGWTTNVVVMEIEQ
jgi:hypothetical protein